MFHPEHLTGQGTSKNPCKCCMKASKNWAALWIGSCTACTKAVAMAWTSSGVYFFSFVMVKYVQLLFIVNGFIIHLFVHSKVKAQELPSIAALFKWFRLVFVYKIFIWHPEHAMMYKIPGKYRQF